MYRGFISSLIKSLDCKWMPLTGYDKREDAQHYSLSLFSQFFFFSSSGEQQCLRGTGIGAKTKKTKKKKSTRMGDEGRAERILNRDQVSSLSVGAELRPDRTTLTTRVVFQLASFTAHCPA